MFVDTKICERRRSTWLTILFSVNTYTRYYSVRLSFDEELFGSCRSAHKAIKLGSEIHQICITISLDSNYDYKFTFKVWLERRKPKPNRLELCECFGLNWKGKKSFPSAKVFSVDFSVFPRSLVSVLPLRRQHAKVKSRKARLHIKEEKSCLAFYSWSRWIGFLVAN